MNSRKDAETRLRHEEAYHELKKTAYNDLNRIQAKIGALQIQVKTLMLDYKEGE